MARLLVRHLDDAVKAKLQRRARRHGHSTEEEVREILRNAVRDEGGARTPPSSRLAARFASAYRDMAGEEEREAEAQAWAETTLLAMYSTVRTTASPKKRSKR